MSGEVPPRAEDVARPAAPAAARERAPGPVVPRPMSPATQRAYRADWAHYATWCAGTGHEPIPAAPATVAAYLASMARSHAPSTIRRRLAALGRMHRFNALPWHPGDPAIHAALEGVRRPGRPVRRAAAIGTGAMRRLVSACEDGPAGRRDRAMLLLAFAGALRRSELVALHADDVTATAEGLRLRLRAGPDLDAGNRDPGNRDPGGRDTKEQGAEERGAEAEVMVARGSDAATCPVRALEAWRAVLVHRSGPLFRRVTAGGRVGRDALWPDAVRRIVLRRAAQAGLAAAGLARLTAHGLRAGAIAEAFEAGACDEDVMRRSRHRDRKTLRGYGCQDGEAGTDAPVRLAP